MTRDEFFAAVCSALGWAPTPWRIAVMNNWATQEGMPFGRTFNPWATTQPGDLDLTFNQGYGLGNWNSVPVRVYRTPEAGIKATVETLQNGYYPNILRCFADQAGYQEAVKPHDFMSWVGSESYGQRLVDFMNSCTESKELEEPMTKAERALGAIAAGEYTRMKACYQAFVAAKLIDETALGGEVVDDDSINSAEMMRWRVLWLQSANPDAALAVVA